MKRLFMAVFMFGLIPGNAAQAGDSSPVLSHAIQQVIVPGFERFHQSSVDMAGAVSAYCEAPRKSARQKVDDTFRTLVRSFGYVEPYRFGPARENNRFERLFFWPDRKGRGLRQVRKRISAKDDSVLEVASLRRKSVAVQGLLSLEFVLTELEKNQNNGDRDFLCGYATANAAAIRLTAKNLLNGWTGPRGYGAVMQSAGKDNAIYKSDREAVQELFRSATEQLMVVKEMKLLAVLGPSPEKAKPKRAPFWRSGNTLALINANLRSVRDLVVNPATNALVQDGLPDQFLFELSNAVKAVNHPDNPSGDFVSLLSDTDADARLRYAVHPIGGLVFIVGERYPAALGLTLGFNSLDGD